MALSNLDIGSTEFLKSESPFPAVWSGWQIALMSLGVLFSLVMGALAASAVLLFDLYQAEGLEAVMALADDASTFVPNVTPAVTLASVSVQSVLLFLSIFLFGVLPAKLSWAEFGFRPTSSIWLGLGAVLAIVFLFVRLAIVLAIVAVVVLVSPDFTDMVNSIETRAELLAPESSLLVTFALIILVSVVVPIVEEMVFRGVLYRWLRGRMTFWVASSVSALIFGLFHFQPLVVVAAALMGFPLAWLYERTGSLWPCIVMHAVTNFFAQGVLYLFT